MCGLTQTTCHLFYCAERKLGMLTCSLVLLADLKELEKNGIEVSDETVPKEPCIVLLEIIWDLTALVASLKISAVHNISVDTV